MVADGLFSLLSSYRYTDDELAAAGTNLEHLHTPIRFRVCLFTWSHIYTLVDTKSLNITVSVHDRRVEKDDDSCVEFTTPTPQTTRKAKAVRRL